MAKKKITVSDAITLYEAFLIDQGKSELTVKNYVGDVRQFEQYYANTLPKTTVVSLKGSVEVVKDYANLLKKDIDVKTSTTNRKIVALRQFFHFCSNDEALSTEVPTDPMNNVGVTKVQGGGQHAVKWLGREEVESILNAIPKIPRTNQQTIARNRAIILTLVNCGLRVGELSELRIGDIDFEKGVLSIRHGKGDKFRQIPITKGTLEAVYQWLVLRAEGQEEPLKESNYLFISERAAKLSERGVQHLTQVLSRVSGIEFSPHTLRHTYCKNIANATGQLQIVADLAGHSNINTTRIYTAPSMPELRKVVEGVEFE